MATLKAAGTILATRPLTTKGGDDLVVVKILQDEDVIELMISADLLDDGELPDKGTPVVATVNPRGDGYNVKYFCEAFTVGATLVEQNRPKAVKSAAAQ